MWNAEVAPDELVYGSWCVLVCAGVCWCSVVSVKSTGGIPSPKTTLTLYVPYGAGAHTCPHPASSY